jgi:ABC-type multidrug transport system permease subunit
VEAKVRELLFCLALAAYSTWLENPPRGDALVDALRPDRPLRLEVAPLGEAPREIRSIQRTLPQSLVMFMLFMLLTFHTVQWVEEVQAGKIRRLVIAPLSFGQIVRAEFVSRCLYSLCQAAFVSGAATLLFGIRWDFPIAGVLAVAAVYVAAVAAFGLWLGTMFRTPEKAHAVGLIVALVLAAIGGCWWPLEIVPPAMRTAALFTPTGLAMTAFGDFLAYGTRAAFPPVSVAGLLCTTGFFLSLAVPRMRRQLVQ